MSLPVWQDWKRGHALAGAALALVLALGGRAAPAFAQTAAEASGQTQNPSQAMPTPGVASDSSDDGDDETFDTKFVKGLLRGIGLKDGSEPQIDYHERSPLVVPPTRDLPPPEAEAAVVNNPDWPRDPDIARAHNKKRAKAVLKGSQAMDNVNPLPPDQLRGSGSGAPTADLPQGWAEHSGQMSPSQLGFKGFDLGSIFNFDRKGQAVQFTQEPPRTALTDPPPGLRTPSERYAYGTKGAMEPTKNGRADQGAVNGDSAY